MPVWAGCATSATAPSLMRLLPLRPRARTCKHARPHPVPASGVLLLLPRNVLLLACALPQYDHVIFDMPGARNCYAGLATGDSWAFMNANCQRGTVMHGAWLGA
jgi:hypothetical protein